ncbi:MAG: hypothetical protein ACRELZ_02680 [Candidatus Rokuibacteriota bacterium]
MTVAALAAIALVLAVLTGAARAQEPRMVPVTIDGESVRLEMRVYEPTTAAPAPTRVFNHGSTGTGTNPAAFTRPLDFPEVARFFVARGWAVVIPARRGARAPRDDTTRASRRIAPWATRAMRCCRSPERIERCATSKPRWARSSRCPSSTRPAW